MEQLFNKYKNIQLCMTKYRLYTNITPAFLDYNEFKNNIQIYGYIKHSLSKDTNDNDELDIYIFKYDSSYLKSTNNFKKLLNQYKNLEKNIILFSKEPLSIYINKAIKQYDNLKVQNLLYKHFIIEINKGPLCSKHSILTKKEASKVCYQIMAHGHRLPSISINDPQNIWIGGKINDIIKIESESEITGISIKYRIVTPVVGSIDDEKSYSKDSILTED